MPVTLAGAFLVQAMIHGSLRVYGAENKVFSISILIHKCLKKIEVEQAEGVLVVPAWTTQTWYPGVLQLLTQAPKLMLWTAGMELVVHPSVHRAHTMKGKLKLIVCPLSGDTMKSEVFRSTLPMYCSTRGDPLLNSNTKFISGNRLYSVGKGKLLHIPLL